MPSIACESEKEPEHTLTFEKDKIVSGETMDVDFDMVGLFFQYTNGSNETIMPADAISVKAFQNGAELTVMVFTGQKNRRIHSVRYKCAGRVELCRKNYQEMIKLKPFCNKEQLSMIQNAEDAMKGI